MITDILLALILVALLAGVIEHSGWLADRKRAFKRGLVPAKQRYKNWRHDRSRR